jgi:cytochrome c-type biogenesis protein CcmH/NrfG
MADAEKTKLLKLEARLSMADGGGDDATVAILEDILKLDPLDGEALMLLGQHFSRHGKPEKAMLAYERAAGIDQFAAAARVKQAQILVSQSRPADAIPLLRQAQEIKPREDVARYLEQVERLAKARR